MDLQWDDSIYLQGKSDIFKYFENRENQLFILGKGFDPRMCEGIKLFHELNNEIDVLLISYLEKGNGNSPINKKKGEDNYQVLLENIGIAKILEKKVATWGSQDESIRKNIGKEFIEKYKDLIIDISAMPKAVSFNLIKRLHSIKNENQKIYIFVCENSDLDDRIEPIINPETVGYLSGFNNFSMGMEAINDTTIVWLPILGYNELPAFKIIEEYLKPGELCPVLPFPGIDAKRGEKIVRYYGQYLFRALEVDKRNIMYVPEHYPLLTYEKLCNTVNYYEHALNPDSKEVIKYVFSTQSSKLMDVGTLLAIIELQRQKYTVGIIMVENEGYTIPDEYDVYKNTFCCVCMDDKEFEW